MKLILKSAVTAALITAAVSAHAQLAVTPTAPGSFPGNTTISPGQNNVVPGNGGLFVTAFDQLTGKSLTEYLGVNFDAFTPATAVTPTGGSNDFGVIGGSLWASTFGSDSNPINFVVVSASNTATSTSIITTVPVGGTTTQRNQGISGAEGALAGVVGTLTNGQASTPSQAVGANPALTLSTTDNGWANIGGILSGFAFGEGTAGGAALDFYEFTVNGTRSTSNGTTTQYANANGAATWSLGTNGDLVYSVPGGGVTPPPPPVPLPAAVWLLGSGLLGLAGIGRRRAAKA